MRSASISPNRSAVFSYIPALPGLDPQNTEILSIVIFLFHMPAGMLYLNVSFITFMLNYIIPDSGLFRQAIKIYSSNEKHIKNFIRDFPDTFCFSERDDRTVGFWLQAGGIKYSGGRLSKDFDG